MKLSEAFDLLHFGRWLTRNGYKYQFSKKRWIKEGVRLIEVSEPEIIDAYEKKYKSVR